MDKKLKIAIIGSRGYPYVYSGYETLVKELSERLVNSGHHVKVYCHSSLFKKKPRHVNGIELVYTPSIETKFLSQFVNSFFSFLHVCFSNIDVVLVVNSANGPFGLFTKIFGKKTCINVDGLEWLRPKWKGLGSYYFYFSSRLSTILFNEIITDSNEMKKIYKNKFKKESTVIAYGSTMKKTKNSGFLNRNGLKKFGYYLIVGRLIPDNNSRIIIDSFLTSKSKKKLVVVGDVPYYDNYANEIKKIDSSRLILTGYIKNEYILSELYRNCYAYLHGHEYGGTNPTMVNALSLNLHILSLDTKFNREMLNNKHSIFFKKNIESINQAIEFFEKKHLEIKSKNKNYKLPSIYNWEKITESYLKLFKNLIK